MGPGWPVLIVGLESGPGLRFILLASNFPFLLPGRPLGLTICLLIPLPPAPSLDRRCAGSDAALDRDRWAGDWRAAAGLRRDRQIGSRRVAARLRAYIIFPAARVVGVPSVIAEVGLGAGDLLECSTVLGGVGVRSGSVYLWRLVSRLFSGP
jgi:hypothetical protein